MKRTGIHLTMISVAVIVVSMLLGSMLSMLTPEALAEDGEQQGSVIEPDGEDISESLPQPEAVTGGLKGGNTEAVKKGRLPGFEDKEINADPEIFCYLLNSDVVLDKPDGMANIMAENDPGNLSPMQLCYYLEGTDELIYVSPMLQPGEYLNGDNLLVKLKKGDYSVNAVISVYDENSMELKTTFHQAVNLTVNQKLLGIF